jgi:hypothetical protein
MMKGYIRRALAADPGMILPKRKFLFPHASSARSAVVKKN